MRPRHYSLVLIAAALWGGAGVVGKLLGDHASMDPVSVAMWRLIVGGVALLAYLAVRGHLHLSAWTRTMWARAALTGALTAVFEVTFFTAISLSSVGLTTLIAIGSAPAWVALYDWVVSGSTPRTRTLVALGMALVGLVLLLGGSLEGGRHVVTGGLLALVTGCSFAAISEVNRRQIEGLPPVVLTGVGFTLGGLMVVPLAFAVGVDTATDLVGWSLLVVLGVVMTAFAYSAYLSGLATVPPFVATIVTLLEPLIAAVLGWIVFSEVLGAPGIVGGVLLGAAVVLLRPQRDAPAGRAATAYDG